MKGVLIAAAVATVTLSGAARMSYSAYWGYNGALTMAFFGRDGSTVRIDADDGILDPGSCDQNVADPGQWSHDAVHACQSDL
jgi:hypothetical protein